MSSPSVPRTLSPLLLVLALFLSLAGLVACGGPEAGAEKAARQWLDALNDGNMTAAQEISTDATKAIMQMGSAMGQSMAVGKYKIKSIVMSNDNAATVTVEAEKENEDMVLDMVRVDGKWKVGIKK